MKITTNWRNIWQQATATRILPSLFVLGYQLFRRLLVKYAKKFGKYYNRSISIHPHKSHGRELWQDSRFPNCIGSIDGKRVELKSPADSGSNSFCNKNFPSIILFLLYGCHSDSGIFEKSAFFRKYIVGKTILPPKPLPGSNIPVPHVLIGDEGFGSQAYLMRPFPKTAWRVFLRPIETDVKTAESIIKAACCLHNYIRRDNGFTCAEIEYIEETDQPLREFSHTRATNQRSSVAAFDVREHFVAYFNN
ncbi:hypothetical protein PR048_021012 [Dryococelus australis]|uniref:DDE Tnp4 domain-containing protein n=1 Tax=Dryococelus australis TaxID=614101 RepID=A0ABQ9GX19_9NEOP|nr:hypothetical protein PR048_021012 [Dryococelus australis]